MSSRKAVTKLQAIIAAVLIFAVAASLYFYILPAPAEFELSNLAIAPSKVEPGEEVTVSATVTNVGEESGIHTVEINLDDMVVYTESVTLNGGTSTIVTFIVTKEIEATYAVEVDGLSGSFEVALAIARTGLQEGNNLPKTRLRTMQSRELVDNRIGGMWTLEGYEKFGDVKWLDELVYGINNLGLKRVRSSFDWFDWPEAENTGEYSRHYIDPNHDKTITALTGKGIKIIYSLVFWDEAIIIEEEGYSRFKTNEEIQRYLDYVQFIVHSFKDRIEYYEILNEPSIREGTQQYVELADYINLVKRTVPVIRREDPKAKILVGAMSPLVEPSNYEYFFGILNSDIMPLVDAISWHVGAPSPDNDYWRAFYFNYPSLLQEIRDVASAHGFKGEFIADEHNWRPPEDYHPDEPWTYNQIVSAKYYARGIVMHLGMNISVGLAGVYHDIESPKESVIQNLCTIMAGAEPTGLPIEILSEATNIRSYSFSLPDGDKLVALWTDGAAVEDDPGMIATLILRGFLSQKVVGIDILNSFEQQLITNIEDGNLVIGNLIVKDYPLILHITKSNQ